MHLTFGIKQLSKDWLTCIAIVTMSMNPLYKNKITMMEVIVSHTLSSEQYPLGLFQAHRSSGDHSAHPLHAQQ